MQPTPLEDQQSNSMDRLSQLQNGIEQLLMIMTSSITYLVQRVDFKQVAPGVPITKSRPKDKIDTPAQLEENKRELVIDLIRKAKQVELLIESLPQVDSEEEQAERFASLEQELQQANQEYKVALERAKKLHQEVTLIFRELAIPETWQ